MLSSLYDFFRRNPSDEGRGVTTLTDYFARTVDSLVNIHKEQNGNPILKPQPTSSLGVAGMIFIEPIPYDIAGQHIVTPDMQAAILMQCDTIRSRYGLPIEKSVIVCPGDAQAIVIDYKL